MRALPYAGVVLLWVLTVAGVALAVNQAFEFDDALLEETRTSIPGERVVTLQARRYNVFFEAPDIADPDRVGDELDLGDPTSSPIRLIVRDPRTERELPVKGYGGSFTMSGARDATAVGSVEVPRAGRYEVSASWSDEARYSRADVALGEPIGRDVLRLVGGLIVAALTFLSGLLVLIVTLVVRSGRRA